ncbi:hypothetical protein DIPPA_32240 [Diplonema papillatum]|nr:hypothetical protein DIPPA_32240 [Diplonema papillatum]
MAKGKRSKIKQKHKREYAARVQPEVDQRLLELHNSLSTDDAAMAKQAPVAAPQAAAADSAMVDLTVAKLAPINSRKMKKAAPGSKIVKSTTTQKTAATKKKKIKITLTAKKRIVA